MITKTILFLLQAVLVVNVVSANVDDVAAALMDSIGSRTSITTAKDEDLSDLLCPTIGDTSFALIFKALPDSEMATYRVADGFEIITISKKTLLGSVELRVLRRIFDNNCRVLVFAKYL